MEPAQKQPMVAQPDGISDRKARLTVSLEESTIRFLYERQAEVNAPSMSAFVESIVTAFRRQSETEELNKQTAAYYDEISDEERDESAAWGQMAELEFLSAKG